ncbi:MAG TPA: protocatechuate 3,4-dioxygenase [Pyrinomonadaceae bacterium]|nr:protocatechuate 3,4-dioxygenase [Pyrinomonadaceae bacterium]
MMNDNKLIYTRRRFLGCLAAGVAAGAAIYFRPGVFADQLIRTPRQTEGPFYPDRLPLDTDNDLIVINNALTPAVGVITHLGGHILDSRGAPVRNAVVEIWQVDSNGAYLHSGSDNRERYDANFQGFGRFETGSTGEYRFRTIKPAAYFGRTPHIHFAVKVKGQDKFTTQCYIKGEPRNERDGVLGGIRDARQRESVIVPFVPVSGSKLGELAARFDIVLGFTPPA